MNIYDPNDKCLDDEFSKSEKIKDLDSISMEKM
jgi:hypothetical protein